MPASSRRWLLVLSALVILAVALVAGFRHLGKGRDGREAGGAGTQSRSQARYHCPMHPTMVSDKPGDCPICGMRLVPIEKKEEVQGISPSGTVPRSGGKRIIYRSTMNPSDISDLPGKDSMGMEREAVEVGDASAGETAVGGQARVRIPARKQQLIGVRTQVVRRAPFIRTFRSVGRVVVDETRLRHVHTKIGGWIEKLHVSATGEKVEKGQPLLSIYSPELLATQEEYLLALRARSNFGAGAPPEAVKRADELLESGRRRLQLYDLTSSQIEELERIGKASTTHTLFAPVSGYVLQRNVTQGEKIDSNATLLDIADLSRVWILASVFESEVPFVQVGQAATVTLAYLPGKVFRGKVGLIYPVLEGVTRTVQVRVELSNHDMELKPEMYVQVELQSDLGERLSIPDSAVLASGTRNIVFVAQGDGYFEPREVRLGLRLSDSVEVLEGLQEGETIVTSGNFLIDSESKLQSALESAAGPPSPPAGAATQPAEKK